MCALYKIKHPLLFAFSNVLALFLIIISGMLLDPSPDNYFLAKALVTSLGFSPFAMGFTIIPYSIAFSIIKSNPHPSLWAYILGGVMSPFFLYMLFIISGASTLISFIAIDGAICGLVYGLLDRATQQPAPFTTEESKE